MTGWEDGALVYVAEALCGSVAVHGHNTIEEVRACEKEMTMNGHGWINALPDGAVARCGGPGLCGTCATETCRTCGCVGAACLTGPNATRGAHVHHQALPLAERCDRNTVTMRPVLMQSSCTGAAGHAGPCTLEIHLNSVALKAPPPPPAHLVGGPVEQTVRLYGTRHEAAMGDAIAFARSRDADIAEAERHLRRLVSLANEFGERPLEEFASAMAEPLAAAERYLERLHAP